MKEGEIDMIKRTKLALMIVLLISVTMTFAGCGTPTVNLNDYVTVSEDGYDGYGSIYASVDFDAILSDYAKHLTDKSLDTQFFGNQTAEVAAEFVFSAYDPYALAYNAGENVKNGDKIEFTWNTNKNAIEQLAQVLEVNFKYDDFKYEVKNLKELRKVDPFTDGNIEMDTWGISGAGSVSPYSPKIVIALDEEIGEIYIDLKVDTSKSGSLANGDTVHMVMEDFDTEYYARHYGVILTRTEADVELNDFIYYANKDVGEVFEYLGGTSLDNAKLALEDFLPNNGGNNKNNTAELVGALYYYQGEGNELKSHYNKHNQMVLIYHINDGIVPGGWYTYMAMNNDIVIGYEETENGTRVKTVLLDTGSEFEKYGMYYQKEYYLSYAKYNHPIAFEYNDTTYVGHRTIEDCIKAYEKNELAKENRYYDYVTASEQLMSYVSVG